MVLHHLREALGPRLYSWISDKQHLHQLGNKVGVPDIVLAADEHHQEGHNVLHAWLIKDLWGIPGDEEEEEGERGKTRSENYSVLIEVT